MSDKLFTTEDMSTREILDFMDEVYQINVTERPFLTLMKQKGKIKQCAAGDISPQRKTEMKYADMSKLNLVEAVSGKKEGGEFGESDDIAYNYIDNYFEIFGTTYKISRTAVKTAKLLGAGNRGDYVLNQIQQRGVLLLNALENRCVLGHKSNDSNGTTTMAGVLDMALSAMPEGKTLTGTFNKDALDNMVAYHQKNKTNKDVYLFMNSADKALFDAAVMSDVNITANYSQTAGNEYGLAIFTYVTPFGWKVKVVLDDNLPAGKMFSIDMAAEGEIRVLDTLTIDQLGKVGDSERFQMVMEDSMVYNPHAIWAFGVTEE